MAVIAGIPLLVGSAIRRRNEFSLAGAIVPEHALNVKVNIPVKANGPLAKKEASAVSNK